MSPGAGKTETNTSLYNNNMKTIFPLNNNFPKNQASSDIYANQIVCVIHNVYPLKL